MYTGDAEMTVIVREVAGLTALVVFLAAVGMWSGLLTGAL